MLNLIIALPAEARPIIARHDLKRLGLQSGMPIYGGDRVRLAVSGPGKIPAAVATAFLGTELPLPSPCAWLNVGVAGHGSAARGSALLAHKVIDRDSGDSYHPAITFPFPGSTTSLVTVDEAETDYPEPCAYDMEASGFFYAARSFASAELVHCLKIVSDTPDDPLDQLSAEVVEALVQDHLDLLEELIYGLANMAAEASGLWLDPPWFLETLKRRRFTFSQRRQLRRLLRRLHALDTGEPVPEAEWAALEKGKDVLSYLRRRLDALAPPRL